MPGGAQDTGTGGMINSSNSSMGGYLRERVERAIALPDLAATGRLAAALAQLSRPGDVLALWGPLGVGKTAFARAFIHALGGAEEVPSPTFTLVQTYELSALTVFHFDLYRLERPDDAYELGIEDSFADGMCLVEWPERLGGLLPDDRLDVILGFGEEIESRSARLVARGKWCGRMKELAP